jgi:hypothetical protein
MILFIDTNQQEDDCHACEKPGYKMPCCSPHVNHSGKKQAYEKGGIAEFELPKVFEPQCHVILSLAEAKPTHVAVERCAGEPVLRRWELSAAL